MNLVARINLAGQSYGWLLAVVVAVLAVVVVYSRPIPALIPATTETHIVPATGEQGFPVETFCEDSKTTVKEKEHPDESGTTYELIRIRDGVIESVVWTSGPDGDNPIATHYAYLGDQQREQATVTKEARECILRKVR